MDGRRGRGRSERMSGWGEWRGGGGRVREGAGGGDGFFFLSPSLPPLHTIFML